MKKLMSIFSMIMLISLVTISGCVTKKPTTSETVSSAEVKELNVTYQELLDAEKIEIEIWHSFSDTIANPMTEYINQFMVKYPNIHVKISKIDGGYDGLKKNVILSLASNTIPNLVLGYPDHFADYLNSKAINALNDYMFNKDENIGFTEAEMNDFVPAYLAENFQFGGGYYYGLPFNKSTEVFQYNKTVFDKLGIQVPKTWDEVKTASQTILDACKDGTLKKLDGTAYTETELKDVYGMTYDSSSNFFITAARQWGGIYTTREGGVTNPKSHVKFNSDTKVSEMLNYFQDAASKNLISVAATWEGALYGTDNFKAQKVFMSIGSTAGVTKNVPADGKGGVLFELGVAPIPQKDLAKNPAVIQQGTNLAMLKKGTDLEKLASWLLIRHLTSTEVTAEFAMTTGYLPVRKSAVATEEYQQYINSPLPADKYNSMGSNAAIQQFDRMFVDPAFIGSSEVRTQAGNIMNSVLVAKKDIKTTIDEAVAQLG